MFRPFPYQVFNFWFPHEQHENDESLQAVKQISGVKDVMVIENPSTSFHRPRGTHDDKKTKIKKKSKTSWKLSVKI